MKYPVDNDDCLHSALFPLLCCFLSQIEITIIFSKLCTQQDFSKDVEVRLLTAFSRERQNSLDFQKYL